MYVRVLLGVFVSMCTHTHAYIHTFIYTYTHTTLTHTHSDLFNGDPYAQIDLNLDFAALGPANGDTMPFVLRCVCVYVSVLVCFEW
jgi:hypothetical protein